MSHPPSAPEQPGPEVVFAGTFVLDVLVAAAGRWLADEAPTARVSGAPYGQLLEFLHTPVPAAPGGLVNVLVIRPEDLLRAGDDATLAHTEQAEARAVETEAALRLATERGAATWLLALTPPSPRLAARAAEAAWVAGWTDRLAAAARATPGLHLVELAELATRYGVAETHDEYGDRLAHLPYTDDYCAALGGWLARTARSAWTKPRKLVVLDCDNTLWSGICGEDGPGGVEISAPHLRLQRFMRDQRARGKLLALCSRNNEADALAVFDRAEMELSLDDITAHRIGWGPKPVAVAELATELGFALDTVVFVDDDPVECAMMRARHPEVAVVPVPADPAAIPGALDHAVAFDQLVVTEDDRRRADRYAQEAERRDAAAGSADYEDFLRRCQTVVELAEPRPDELERAAQLTARTTQFNLTGERFDVAALRGHLRAGRAWSVTVRDRFGDYGTVGLVLAGGDPPPGLPAAAGGDSLDVRLLLVSCRVLNRGVEREILAFLRARAADAGHRQLRLPYRETARNTPARLFLEGLTGEAPRSGDWTRLPLD